MAALVPYNPFRLGVAWSYTDCVLLAFFKCHGLYARLILRPYLALCAIICLSVTYTYAPTINVGLISQTPTFRWLWHCWPTAFPRCSVSNTNALGFETCLPSLCLGGQHIGLKRSITLPQNVRLSSFLSICNSYLVPHLDLHSADANGDVGLIQYALSHG